MAIPIDPYRTLELPAGASFADVKRAYRRLAKRYHPDSGGPAMLRRFLAIQAAYETIVSGRASVPPGARASTRSHQATGPRGPARARGQASGARGPEVRNASSRTGGSGAPNRSAEPGRRRTKATLGSTSYDGAEEFEPSWEGATWYGTTSGTYWTVNPREYADPRKHGPEYLAKTRPTRTEVAGVADTPARDASPRAGGGPRVRRLVRAVARLIYHE